MSSYCVLDGDRGYRFSTESQVDERLLSPQTWIALGFALIYGFHLLVRHLDLAILSPAELLWNAIVYIVPVRLIQLLAHITGTTIAANMSEADTSSELRAMKSEALRQILRLSSAPRIPLGLQNLKSLQTLSPVKVVSDKPPGLGNWDNSCYQNSILQGLSALPSLAKFLDTSVASLGGDTTSTTASLHTLTKNLTTLENNGKRIWTPAKLKSMSSWQQQDAQEYYSRVLDDVEKDLKKAVGRKITSEGLKEFGQLDTMRSNATQSEATQQTEPDRCPEAPSENPLEGLLGQRVACVSCGHSEGLAMLPFNCLTVSLGTGPRFSLESLLDDYTKLEDIDGVECLSCTFKRQEQRLESLLNSTRATPSKDMVDDPSPNPAISSSTQIHEQIKERLERVKQVKEDGDFTDQAIKKCAVTKESKISSTKTKQVVLARPPKSLAIHVNRSIFDEMTGALRKNLAYVGYPKYLSLKPWTLGQDRKTESGAVETWPFTATQSLVSQHHGLPSKTPPDYVLRAVVTHYGRHENGHYICYRQHRQGDEHSGCDESSDVESAKDLQKKTEQWWRLSDDDVSEATEEEVLNQGGVFMLFYERLSDVMAQSLDVETSSLVKEANDSEVRVLNRPEVGAEAVQPDDGSTVETLTTDNKPDTSALRTSDDGLPTEKPSTELANSKSTSERESITAADEKQATKDQSRPKTTPQKLRTSRAKPRKGSGRMQPGLPTVTAQ
ncbi:ubiquitin carboxyl-terminal hydrolase-containing protein [Elsinoe australis]|uniref:ubiquitinyl hydrolase 1 n=1 Tax=Elsinoe australis TaxID=40998 RepID=A0A4V6DWM2_9PEZI|nr:ubiquitin carboxyl-terminal hydrolase-containing protein [Elsinoe australis]